jgi:UDP-glucose 4-epimerase
MAANLGTGIGTSVLELVEAVGQVAGRPVPIKRSARRPGDPDVLVADARRVRDVLGWLPRYTNIKDIVVTAWNWHRSR